MASTRPRPKSTLSHLRLWIFIAAAILGIFLVFLWQVKEAFQLLEDSAVTANFVNELSTGLDNFYEDEGHYPGNTRDPDTNAFPDLFEALLGERRLTGGGDRFAPYVTVEEREIVVLDRATGVFRRPTSKERWDVSIPKYILDPWGNPYWYRVNKGREKADWMRRPLSTEIWSIGPDKVNSNTPSTFYEESDDIGNW